MTIHSVVIQKLLSTNAHMGRRVAAHHFKIYSCGTRNAMTIIDSDKTLICLRNACNFIGNLVRANGRFLFVNTNSLFDEIIAQMTKSIGCKNDNSWKLGGFLTNSSSPKKFRGRNKKLNLGAIQAPDCVVIFDTERKSSVIHEASKLQIPIVGLVDSSMPLATYKRITYPVPANDSVQFVYLFCNLITKTFLYEQKQLMAASGGAAKSEIREDVQQISESKISNKDQIFVLPYESLAPTSDVSETKQLLDKLVVVKFNGNVGANMGFAGPNSAIEVCNGYTCLDLFINQLESLNSKYGCNIPLLLVNTENTHVGTMKALEKHPNKNVHAFIQSQRDEENVTDVQTKSSTVENSLDKSVSEILLSLKKSGNLDVLLSQGKEYMVVLKSDNLGHVVDEKILHHLIQNELDHCLEVMPASYLEETEPLSHEGKFQSKEKFEFSDVMWVSMSSVERLVERSVLNESYTISQLFDRAYAINVPKSRHLPVEATSDLLLLQSDLYTLADGVLTRNVARVNPVNPSIELGPEFENVNVIKSRFKSIPSIVELESLKVSGDVSFGSGVTLKGEVHIFARPGMRITVPDGAVLQNKVINSQVDIEVLL